MIPEIGNFALMVATAVALVLGTLPIIGAARGNARWMALARPAARVLFLLVLVAASCLVSSFLHDDFSVRYVAINSTHALPVQYKLAAFWGGHEGSMLLWLVILSFWMFAVSIFSAHLPREMVARILGVMGLIALGFLLFIVLTSDPFDRLLPAVAEGNDLNPLLQDPGMVVHPPMLYMGYVGFSVAFAFAIAALLGGNLDATWARWSRPWTTVAWTFLTVGICMGSAWAYYTLGWGGWWFWDPVENASFMPWLAGTALMHSLAVTEKRSGFKVWTVLLAIFAFSLSLLGTFLVRSGVLTSVHAFASDPRRGVFILLFLATVIGGSLALFAWRAPKVGLGERFEIISRESMLLTNNVLFLGAAACVLLGTLYPLMLDSLGLGKISVGPPYFDTVFVPLMAPALFLMGIGPLARWRKANLPEIAARLKWAAAVSVICAVLVPLIEGRWSFLVSAGILLACWIFSTSLVNLWSRVRPAEGGQIGAKFAALPRGYLGMLTAHIGVAVFIVGVTLVKGYEVEKDVRMDVGDTTALGPYKAKFVGTSEGSGPNYQYLRGQFEILRGDKAVRTMYPEKRGFGSNQSEPMTDAAIAPSITGDLYISMGEPVSDTAWVVRVYYKPFIDWIWGGCLLMAVGGVLALSDRRYRLAQRRATDPELTATGAASPA
ncbi:heme lyase, CcmF subunit [Burkholderiales bacterium]|jgi:cytochrome c-type biogenesis protein CcmF|nr:heme lyase, CcmF subunit [Burkholderiales bacterium]